MPLAAIVPFRPVDLPQKPPMEDPPTRLSDHLLRWVHELLTQIGLDSQRDAWLDRLLIFAAIVTIGCLLHVFCRHVVIPIIAYTARHSRLRWDSILLRRRFFAAALSIVPPVAVLVLLPLAVPVGASRLDDLLTKVLAIYMTIVFKDILVALAGATFDYYRSRESRDTSSPYQTAYEMAVIFIKTLMILCVAGILLNLTLSGVVTILSAFAALLVIVFKDTLLGFIAGMVLLRNQMVKLGDWIEVNNPEAKGQIEDISIMTLRLRDRDNTFHFVPTYALVTRTFRNFAGMKASGIRRVDRVLVIDAESVKNKAEDSEKATPSSNLAEFRQWLISYLESLPNVSRDPYIIVRIDERTDRGCPVEMFFFLKVTAWAEFETAQSVIAEEILAQLPEFGLRLLQPLGLAEKDNASR